MALSACRCSSCPSRGAAALTGSRSGRGWLPRHRSSGPAQQRRRRPAAAASFAESGAGRQAARQPRPENAPGDFYVDSTCIDCDTCHWMAPEVFTRVGGQSAATQQPQNEAARAQALQALLACPTYSIHVRQRRRGELAAAAAAFPLPLEGCRNAFHCGFASESSFGATAYVLRRQGGNVLVDVPRWQPALAERLRQLGGVKYIFLTHRDDVADHALWAQHMGAQRIIHRLETNRRQGTECEVQLEGEGPWALPDGGEDCQLLFTPGHTPGCLSLLYRPDAALFTGDHLAYSTRLGRLTIFRAYNWHCVEQQLRSVDAPRAHRFLHVLPGHGRRARFADWADQQRQLAAVLQAEGWPVAGAPAAATY